MKKVFFAILAFVATQSVFAQGVFKSSIKSVYAMYGFHFTTTYHTTSGTGNLIGRKTPFSVEAGLNLDYPLTEHFYLRSGIASHLHFLSEITYGISGTFPSNFHPNYKKYSSKYSRGIDYIEIVNVGIPFKAGFTSPMGEKYTIAVSAGPMINFYFTAKNIAAGAHFQNLSGSLTQAYEVDRIFKNDKDGKSIGISYPQLELDADITVKRKFKHLGLIGLGVKGHLGTQRLEKSTFVIWPTEPAYRSEGHFKLNRSYFGFFASYTFRKRK